MIRALAMHAYKHHMYFAVYKTRVGRRPQREATMKGLPTCVPYTVRTAVPLESRCQPVPAGHRQCKLTD